MGFEKINSNDDSGELKDKVILLHGFSDRQLSKFMEAYKNNPDMPKAHIATTTPVTRMKKVKDVLMDIIHDGGRP